MKHANPETEWVVISALLDCEGPLLKTPADALLSACGLVGEDFTHPAARAWFDAIRTLAARQSPVDANTAWSVSRGMPGVPTDGHTQLQALQGANSCNRVALLTHAQQLRRLARLRALETFFREQLNAIQGADADPALLAARLDTFGRGFAGGEEDFGSGDQDLLELSEEWEAAVTGRRKPYLATGIFALDAAIMGWEENLNLVGGAPSAGKSALIATAIYNALLAGERVCIIGLEDGTKWIPKRVISRCMGMPVKDIGKVLLQEKQQRALQGVMGELANTFRPLVTWKRGGLGTGQLVQLCKRAIHVERVRAIFIDHGLEVQHEGLNKGDELRTRVQNTFARLRDLAVETHTPIVVVVHFNREQGKSEAPPTMQQFAECAGIERMARLAIGLWEREQDGPEWVRCTVIKQTEGPKNVHLLLRRELEHALISNGGGSRLDLRAEKESRRLNGWRSHADLVGGAQ